MDLDKKINNIMIKFNNVDSRYEPFNIVFMRMFNKLNGIGYNQNKVRKLVNNK